MPWTQVGNLMGPQGPPGEGIAIKGTVATHADLPTAGNSNGDVWITEDTGHGWVYDNALLPGDPWVDIGPLRGPEGPPGLDGADGQDGRDGTDGQDGQDGVDGVRGSLWYSQPNDPTTVAGELVSDHFLNTVTGDLFRFDP